MTLSVVIPLSQNRCGEALCNCIASLQWQTFADFSVMLVVLETKELKWGPLFDTRKKFESWAEDEGLSAIIQRNPFPVWAPSLARNIGFRHRPTPFLASLDSDAVLGPAFLEKAHEKLAAGYGVRASTYMCEEYPFWSGFKTPDRVEKALARRKMRIGSGPGCFIGAPKASIWKVRGWDEAFRGYGPTDWDFVRRLQQSGLRIVNLAKVCRQFILHQNHARHETTQLQKYIEHNRKLYAVTKARTKGPARNWKGWGGKR